jgi:hypothetical protein
MTVTYTAPPLPEAPPWDYSPGDSNPEDAPSSQTPLDEKRPRYVIHWADEALEPQPPIEWIVQDVFSAGSLSVIAGDGGSGKTWALLDCAVSVANGTRWLGRAVRHSAVLWVDEDMGERRVKMRLGDVIRGHGETRGLPLAWMSLTRFDLWNLEDVAALQSAIMDTGAQFVVIDALVDVMPGRNENDTKDTQPIMMALRKISEDTNSAIVLIHHNNKTGTYRGSTAIKGAIDLMLMVEKVEDVLNFKAEKARDVDAALLRFAARCNWGIDTFNLSPADAVPDKPNFNKSQFYVLRYLSEHGASLFTEIQDRADSCSSNAAKLAVYNLTTRGFTRRTDGGKAGEKATYDLTEAGKTALLEAV